MSPSAVWKYFTKSLDEKWARCCKCNKQLTYCKSTSSLKNHLERVHKIVLEKSTREKSATVRSYSGDNMEDEDIDDPSSTPTSTSAPSSSNTTEVVPASSSNSDEARSNASGRAGDILDSPLIKCLQRASSFKTVDNMPLQTSEKKGFRRFVQALQPLYKIPCEDTCTKRLDRKYELLKAHVGKQLAERRRIVLTTDLWTETKTTRSFLGLTAHYLDGVCLRSVTLGARLMEDRKTAENLKDGILNMIEDWKITTENVSGIVTDHGANIVAAAQAAFGASKHFTCFAHAINLVAQTSIGLYNNKQQDLPEEGCPDNDELDDLSDEIDVFAGVQTLKKLKKIVGFYRRSEVATKELNDLQKKEMMKKDSECLRLVQVRTRWNSLYDMIDRFLELEALVDRALAKISRERSSRAKPPDRLTLEEVEMLRNVRDVLKPLWQATMEISAEKSVTISKVIPTVSMMILSLNEVEVSDPVAFNMRVKILEEINKRFGKVESNLRYAAATLLDPRFKKLHFDTRSTALANAITHVGRLVQQKINASRQLAEQSAAQAGSSRQRQNESSREPGENSFWKGHHQLVAAQRIYDDQESFGGAPLELRQYLNRPVCALDRNPLEEWQVLKRHHPHVFEVAEELLPILATSVPAERLFSKAGQLVTKLRNRLTGEHIEKLLFLQSLDEYLWFKT